MNNCKTKGLYMSAVKFRHTVVVESSVLMAKTNIYNVIAIVYQ